MSALEPLETLYDGQQSTDLPLPPALASLYGRLQFPPHPRPPYVIGNFVTTLDGVVALNDSDQSGGGEISGSNQHDRPGEVWAAAECHHHRERRDRHGTASVPVG